MRRLYVKVKASKSNLLGARVQNVQATDMEGAVEISWSELTGLIVEEDGEVVKYIIQKRVNNGIWQLEREITEIDWVDGFFIMDLNVEAGNTYYYRIKAETSLSKQTAWSAIAEIELEEEPAERGTVTNITYSSVYGIGQNFGYKQYVPVGYDGNTATPLVIWLHGLGERSQSNGNPQFARLELYGPFKEYKDFEADYPFLMIAPQQPTDVDGKYTGRGSWDVEVIEESLNHFKSQGYNIDLDRVYITGQSMGGGGVLSYINSVYGNDTIAAALPIASTLPQGTGIACNIKHIPIWLFHAENDPTVSSNNSKNLYTAINACTPAATVPPKITIFNLSSHTGWNQVYRNTGASITEYPENSPFPDGTTWEDWLLQYSLQSELSPAVVVKTTFESTVFPDGVNNLYYRLPEGHDEAGKTLPLVIFFHGLSEFGTDISKLWVNGPAKHIEADDDLEALGFADCVFVAPQQDFGTYEHNVLPLDSWNDAYVDEVVTWAINTFNVDPDRVNITGLSMGGKAVDRYVTMQPQKIHKAMMFSPNTSSGRANPQAYDNVRVWMVHGSNDSTSGGFSHGTTQTLYNDLITRGISPEVKFSKPSGVGHNSWAKVYDNTANTWTLVADGLDPIGGENNANKWLTSGAKITPPVIIWNIANDAIGIPIDSTIVAISEEPLTMLDGSEITNGNVASLITLKGNGNNIAFSASISGDKKTITITPNADFAKDLEVEVVLASVAGNKLHPSGIKTLIFETESAFYVVERDVRLTFANQFEGSNPTGWNTLKAPEGTAPVIGTTYNDLEDFNEVPVDWEVEVVQDFQGAGNATAPGNVTIGDITYPGDVVKSSWNVASFGASKGIIMISGLNPNKYYEVFAYGFHTAEDRGVRITVTGDSEGTSQDLDLGNNTTTHLHWEDIASNGNGQLFVSVEKGSKPNNYSNIGALVIRQSNLPKP